MCEARLGDHTAEAQRTPRREFLSNNKSSELCELSASVVNISSHEIHKNRILSALVWKCEFQSEGVTMMKVGLARWMRERPIGQRTVIPFDHRR